MRRLHPMCPALTITVPAGGSGATVANGAFLWTTPIFPISWTPTQPRDGARHRGIDECYGQVQCLRARVGAQPTFPEPIVQLIPGLKALASPTRLKVLELLRNPAAFDGPRDAAGQPLGVTAKALLKHFRLAQPSFNEQMNVLIGIGLVEATKVGRWTVYKRDEERIRQLKQTIIDQLLPPA